MMREFMDLNRIEEGLFKKHADLIPYGKEDDGSVYKRSKYCMSLDGMWRFSFYQHVLKVPEDFYESAYADDSWDEIRVPSCWQTEGYGKKQYLNNRYPFPADPPYIPMETHVGCYRRMFTVPKDFQKKRIHLVFDGVCSAYRVWVNGKNAGFSQGSHMMGEFDITDLLCEGENVVAVQVYQYSFASYLECQDMWRFNGIFRSVYLVAKESCELYHIETSAKLCEKQGAVFVKACMLHPKEKYRVRLTLEDQGECVAEKTLPAEQSMECRLEIKNPALWSAETPNLYQLKAELIKDEQIAEIYYIQIGFRTIEIQNGVFLINGNPVKLKGVNHHDTSPDHGYTMSRELMEQDVLLMKQHNVNAVRTSHYPPDTYFLDLCDRYGLYVIDEADVEAHGGMFVEEWNRLAEDEDWQALHVNRAERMVKRDINHPSVVMWSLGNESGEGKNHTAMADYIHSYDPTRPIHYECAKKPENQKCLDVASEMYPTLEVCEDYVRDETNQKPLFLCEFAHSMGNSPGGLREYVDLFYQYDRCMGGCVWEWADHGVLDVNKKGEPCYRYGGDYGDVPNDGNFCCDGLCFPDRTPHTGLLHMKNIYAPIEVKENAGEIELINRYDMLGLSGLYFTWEVIEDGCVVQEGKCDLPEVCPHQKARLAVPYDSSCFTSEREYFLNLHFKIREKTAWADAGYELCRKQVLLSAAKQKKDTVGNPGKIIDIWEEQERFVLSGEGFCVEFSKLSGTIENYTYYGKKLIDLGPRLQVSRPVMDNDWCFGNDDGFFKIWKNAGVYQLKAYVREIQAERKSAECICITCRGVLAAPSYKPLFRVTYHWTFYADAHMHVKIEAEPGEYKKGERVPFLPKIGTQSVLSPGAETAEWYGRGPMESYPDKNDAALIGHYKKKISDLFENHIKPQENGNREEIRWVSIEQKSGFGLRIYGDWPMNFSARFYTDRELRKKHADELLKTDQCIFNFDDRVAGVGTGSCGPKTLEKYRVKPDKTVFQIHFEPYKPAENEKEELS